MNLLPQRSTNVVWEPIRGTSQELAITSPCNVTLYAGSRGPGKTDTQLMYFRQYVGQGYGKFWRGVILDREYKNLDDLVSKSKRWFPKFGDGCQFRESKADYKWIWPSGEELLFRSAEDEADYWKYHGQEFAFIGWNELTQYPKLDLFDMFMSCNRSSYVPRNNGYIGSKRIGRVIDLGPEEYKVLGETESPEQYGQTEENVRNVPVNPWTGQLPAPIPLRVFATTNPFGAGHYVCKTRFIDPAPYGQIVKMKSIVFNPKTKEDVEVTRTQVAIFGSWRENIYLDPVYIATLKANKDPNMRKAWDTGSWDINAGGPFDDVWDANVHIVPRFRIPAGWYVDRAYDWGSTEPFAYGLWAESNGEEAILPDGTVFAPPAGTLVLVYELYGTEALGTNRGLRWSSKVQAQTIIAHEQSLIVARLINSDIHAGPADNQIRNVNDSGNATVEAIFNENDLYFTASDKSSGSRIVGLELFRQRLENSKTKEGPGIYFCRNCIATITTVPSLPRNAKNMNDVETKGVEDHLYDMIRYKCLSTGTNLTVDLNTARPK